MSSIRAGAAFVTLQIKEEVRQGLSQAKSKLSAFADYVKNAIGGKASQALSFKDVAQGLVGGAVLMNLAKIALENEKIAAAAEKANEALRSMVLDVSADLEEELIWLLDMAGFLLKKMADGFKAIIAVAKDFGSIVKEGDFSFKNFNKVLDNLDRPSSGAKAKEIDKHHDKVKKLKKTTQELTDAQKQYDSAWENARSAGASVISDLQREMDVLKRGEANVKADELYKQKLESELKLMEAKRVAEGGLAGFTNQDKDAIKAQEEKAQALKDQYLFLEQQKLKLDQIKTLDEERKKVNQEIADHTAAQKREIDVLRRGETAVRADEIYQDSLQSQLRLLEAQKNVFGQLPGFAEAYQKTLESAIQTAQSRKSEFLELEARKLQLSAQMMTRGSTSAFALGAGGRASGVGQTQRDLLKEAREQKEIAKKNLEQLEIIAKGGMVFG